MGAGNETIFDIADVELEEAGKSTEDSSDDM